MKIRIFALAKDLGLDSKELIEIASKAGIQIKNSPLASISPEERDVILSFLKSQEAAPKEEERPMAPVREQFGNVGGKVREIRVMTPRPQHARPSRPAAETSASGSQSAIATADDESERDIAPAVAATAVEEEAEIETAAAAATVESESAVAETTAEGAAEATAEADVQPETEPASKKEAAAEAKSADEEDKPAADAAEPDAPSAPTEPVRPAIRKDDYVPSSGVRRTLHDMKPRGTISDSESQSRQQKSRPKPQAPRIAAPPEFRAPKPKEKGSEAPAQKPVMKLTQDILEGHQSPLRAHIKKNAEQRERGAKGGDRDLAETRGLVDDEAPLGKQMRQPSRQKRFRPGQDDQQEAVARPRINKRRKKPVSQHQLKSSAQIEPPITVRSLSEAIGRPAKSILQLYYKLYNSLININDFLDEEVAVELCMELGVELEIKHGRDIEQELLESLESDGDEEKLQPRPPIITILGHVDHGKTTLVDKLRSANVAAGEAGGITQHIAAYQVEHNGHKLTFVDTPGHAAFGEMRARGANVTDIVVLVVAADDGVMPQTQECISHAKNAGVPIVVAMNKMDLPDANPQKVLQDLAQHDVLPAEWGGDVEVVRTSGITGEGLDDLLETLLVTAELNEFKADPNRPAVGVCLEAFRHEGRGALAWFVVQKGTLRVGDVVVCGPAYGRIRAMYDDRDREVTEAGPSAPVKVAGLDTVPGAGDHFFVLEDIDEAREVAEKRRQAGRVELLAHTNRPRTLDDILGAARSGAVQDLPLIIKADTPGSLEALRGEIEKFEHPEVRVKIVHSGVGGVNESDVSLASAAGAIIIAFHVVPEDRAEMLAEQSGVEIRRFNIIYEVTDTIKRTLEGLLIPERIEVPTGRALVLQTFHISRFGTVAGCRVLKGTIERNHRVHVVRDQKLINDYNIASLKREKDDVKEVREGMECGIRLEGFDDVKPGDLLEAYKVEEVKRTLD